MSRVSVALLCALLSVASAAAKSESGPAPDIAAIAPADILFIGDSQNLGYFGAQLYRSLSSLPDPKTRQPLSVWGFWVCGSDVEDWLEGGKTYCGLRVCDASDRCVGDYGPYDRHGRVVYQALRVYAAKVHPRATVVSVGSNLLTWSRGEFRDEYASYMAGAGRMADEIVHGGSRCIWIGPPQVALTTKSLKDYEQFVADLRRAVTSQGCAFIDSNPLSDRKFLLRSDSEGIHYGGTGERAWEAGVWAQLRPVLQARLAH